MAFVTKLTTDAQSDLRSFLDNIFFDCEDKSSIFLTAHSEQIKGETPWPARTIDQILSSSQNNTFHYCISTFKRPTPDDRLRRRITDFNALHVIVLDDIGTKVQPPSLTPSYIIETSKDNYQYGYILDGAIRDRNIANALIHAIYSKDANLSDAGGKAITKMVKLPIGINLKDGRNNFPVTLKEFSGKQYNYYDLLTQWNLLDTFKQLLISGKTILDNTQVRLESQLSDNDVVFQWLSDNNIITHDNGNGYFVCNCPRGDEHGDGNPSSGSAYKPLGYGERPNERHFKCHHEHAGLSPTTDEFLMWVREQGGPSVGRVARQTSEKINYLQMAPLGIYPDIHTNTNSGKPLVKQTIENLQAMLQWYGLTPERNVYKDEILLVDDDGRHFTTTDIYSISKRNMLPFASTDIDQFIEAMSINFLHNPVLDWLKHNYENTAQSNGCIDEVFDLIPIQDKEIYEKLLRLLWRKWVIQCVAAADAGSQTPNNEAIPKFESTLILVGSQGVRKTSFLRSLIPEQLRQYFAEGALLNLKDKDSIIKARSYWICELGELDATFRRSDISELKAYLSSTTDQYRAPYGRVQRTWARRTSFCASVNESKFLHDFTGNRRFWTLEINGHIQWPSQAQVQAMWAEAYKAYISGESWWVEYDEMQAAEKYTQQFSSANDEWFVHDIYRIFGLDDNPQIIKDAYEALKIHKTNLLYSDEFNKSDFKAYTTQDLLAMSEKVSTSIKPNRYTSMLKNSEIPHCKLRNNREYFILPKQVKKY